MYHGRGKRASPLVMLLKAGRIRRIELAARSGASELLIGRLCRLDPEDLAGMRLDSICKVAAALGCAPAEIIPWLAARPRTGLLYERRVFGPRRHGLPKDQQEPEEPSPP